MRKLIYLIVTFSVFLVFWGCSSHQEKVVWIARDPSWYPVNMMGKGDNLLSFTDELLYAVAKDQGLHVELFTVSTGSLMEGLDEKVYTAVISFVVPTDMNKEDYLFSDPYYLIGPVLVVQNSSNIKKLADLQGKILGVQTGSSFIFDAKNYPDISISTYENIQFALENLSKGQIDGVIMDSIAADVYTSSFYKGKLEIASGILTKGGLRLIVLKDKSEEEIISLFNTGLQKLKEDGRYGALLEKWGLFNPEKNEKK